MIFRELYNRLSSLRTPETLTILRNDHLGDLILTLPLLQQASDWLGSGNLHVVIDEPYEPILEDTSIDCSIHTDPKSGVSDLAKVLADTGADTLITATSTTRNSLASQLSGIPQRLGFGYKVHGLCFTHPLFVHRKNPARHEAEFCLDYLREFPEIDVKPARRPNFSVDPEPGEQVRINHDLGSSYGIIHPGHSGSAHHPSRDQYRAIADRLRQDRDILLTNKGSEERRETRRIADELECVVPLDRDLSIREFASVVSGASLFVGGSSGPLHLASLTRTPRIGLYSNDPRYEPAKWKPLGEDQIIITPKEGRKLPGMKPESLAEKVLNQARILSS